MSCGHYLRSTVARRSPAALLAGVKVKVKVKVGTRLHRFRCVLPPNGEREIGVYELLLSLKFPRAFFGFELLALRS